MSRVHILGNSNAYGFGVEDRSWPALIKAETNRRRHLGEQPRVTTINAASPGNLLFHVLESGLLEASVNCNRRGRQIGLFCVGACEASILRSRGQTMPRRGKADFANDLNQLVGLNEKLNTDQPSESAMRLILMGTVPVDDTKSFHSQEGDDFNGQAIREYESMVKDCADTNDIPYVDLRTGFDGQTMLANDGIHLSEEGDAFVYARVMPVILEELGIETPAPK